MRVLFDIIMQIINSFRNKENNPQQTKKDADLIRSQHPYTLDYTTCG